ncbi:quinolinate synthase NadA [Pseudodesulfovibrio pelocollis]|uniref:quinolinate synthase NadA n=1 Tax=Pseudodesulfovibrio pelocollis TaxID=3051432 RepID=UPI00255ABA6B|nr:quinolinate synthase NadA [Pseudodesulfovibrio sp. SB368]
MENSVRDILAIKEAMGSRLAILGHHYQSDAVIALTDIQGDSLELARRIGDLDAEHIVFCGVFFMAESAAILRRPGQKIHIPDTNATCPMADMADAGRVEAALNILQADGRTIIPLTYVNSSAAVKGVVGRFGGSVCTSANAATMLAWAMERGDGVLFLPDKHLAMNTANALNIPEGARVILPQGVIDGDPRLFIDPATVADKRLMVWPGYCPIHEKFSVQTVAELRTRNPDIKIVVHPECDPAVVQAADGSGSTTYLINYVTEAPAGSIISIGTEINLVSRLAKRFPDKTIKPLSLSQCDDMAKITTDNLAALLRGIETATPVEVDETIKTPARLALQRMLDACA